MENGRSNYHTNSKTPFHQLSKNTNSRTQIPPRPMLSRLEIQRNHVKHKEYVCSQKEKQLIQELQSMNAGKKGLPVEETVRFHFGDDYDNHLFHEAANALLLQSVIEGTAYLGGKPVRGNCMEYSDEEIFNLSSEKGMIDSFLEENFL